MKFEVQHSIPDPSGVARARACRMVLPGLKGQDHELLTPMFMPVGTVGSVKATTTRELREMHAQIILGNTYHLYLRPGHERVERLALDDLGAAGLADDEAIALHQPICSAKKDSVRLSASSAAASLRRLPISAAKP